MKQKKILALVLALVMVLALLPAVQLKTAEAEDVVFYTLNPASGSNNSYAGNCDIEIDGITWNLTGNSTLNPWRIGGKNIADTDRALYSKTAMGSAITKVVVTVGAANNITVNSFKMIVASDAEFSNIIEEVTEEFSANSEITFTPSPQNGYEWATGAYYKFVFNVTVSGNSNRFLEFSKAEFYKASGNDNPTYTFDAAVNDTNYGRVSVSGNTITATPEEGYYAANATVNPDGAATVTRNGNVFTVSNLTANCTITINFAAKTQVTATYLASDEMGADSFTENHYLEDGDYTVAANTFTAPADKQFKDWLWSEQNQEVDPGDEVTLANGANTFVAQWEDIPNEIDDVLTVDTLTATNSTYTDFSGIDKTKNGINSDAVYAGKSGNSNNAITINNKTGKIVTTASGGTILKVTIAWGASSNQSNKVNIYGSNSPFSASDDLSNPVATLAYGTTAYTFTDSYAYVAINGTASVQLDQVTFTWGAASTEPPTPVTTYTVTYKESTEQNAATYNHPNGPFEANEQITLANCTFTAPEGKEFDKWLLNGTTEMGATYTIAAADADENNVIYFLPQWKDVTPPQPVEPWSFTKVTNTADVEDGEYLIVYEDGSLAFNSADAKDAVSNGAAVTINNDTIEANSNLAFTFALSDDNGFSILASNGMYIGQTSDANGLVANETVHYNSVVIGADGAAEIVSGGAYLRFNSASNQMRFRYYKSTSYSGQQPIALYKHVEDTPEPPTPTLADGFYLARLTDTWTVADLKAEDRFDDANPVSTDPYQLKLETKVKMGERLKVVYILNGAVNVNNDHPYGEWYAGDDNGYVIDAGHAGNVTIYFKTGGDLNWGSGTGYYMYIEPNAPEFVGHSLYLDGQIGVNFIVSHPSKYQHSYNNSKVTFTITYGNCTEEAEGVYQEDSGFYKYTCYVNSLQMAETITATFHYYVDGAEQTVENAFGVSQYFAYFDEHVNDFTTKAQNLIKALRNYGAYVQTFLSKEKHFTVGEGGYAPVQNADASLLMSVAADTIPDTKRFVKENWDGEFSAITYSLVLDSATAIKVYFTPKGEMPTVTLDGIAYEPQKVGNRYVVKIDNIQADDLEDNHVIVAGNATVHVTALAYVNSMFNVYNGADNNTWSHPAEIGDWSKAARAIYSYWYHANEYLAPAPANND